MPILLSSPQPTVPVKPPEPPAPLPPKERWIYGDHFPGIEAIEWTGWNGDTWQVGGCGDYTTGVILGRRVRGLHYGDLEEWSSESPAVDGAQHLGYRARPREVFFTVRVYSHTMSQEWIEHDSRWWRSMLPASPGVRGPGRLTITQPNGAKRWLDLWPRHTGDHEFEVDPARRGWAVYGQYLTAYRPYWTSDRVSSHRFTQGGASGFFGGSVGGRGTPFVIGSQSVFGAATISNPGEEPAWPVWTVRGPFTSAKIGVPGQLSEIRASVASGDWLTIDTDPLAQSVTDSTGAARYPTQITGAPFAAIPPGQNRPLIAEMEGTGSIDVSLQPLYHRAW